MYSDKLYPRWVLPSEGMVAISMLGTRCAARQSTPLPHCGSLSLPMPLTPDELSSEWRHKHRDIPNICRANTNEDKPRWQWNARGASICRILRF